MTSVDDRYTCNVHAQCVSVKCHLSLQSCSLHNQYPNQHPESYKDYCDHSLKNSMYCAPVDRSELESLINKLKNGKSPGADNIGVKMVKENAFILVDPLIHLFNLSITTGIVPDKLKIAKVVPVYTPVSYTHLTLPTNREV